MFEYDGSSMIYWHATCDASTESGGKFSLLDMAWRKNKLEYTCYDVYQQWHMPSSWLTSGWFYQDVHSGIINISRGTQTKPWYFPTINAGMSASYLNCVGVTLNQENKKWKFAFFFI